MGPSSWLQGVSGRRDEQRREQRLAELERQLDEAPRSPQLHLRVAELYELTQRHARAVQHFERSSELFGELGQQACAQAALRRARVLRRRTQDSPVVVTEVPVPASVPAHRPHAEEAPGGWEAEPARTETWNAPLQTVKVGLNPPPNAAVAPEVDPDAVTHNRRPMSLSEIEDLIRVTNQLGELLAVRNADGAGKSRDSSAEVTRAGALPHDAAPALGDAESEAAAPTQLVAISVGELPIEPTVLARRGGGSTVVREAAPDWVRALQETEFDRTDPGVAR